MNRHLSSEELCAWLAGSHTLESEQHVLSCSACHAEMARMGQALTQFRGAVRGWSEEQYTREVRLTPVNAFKHFRWAWAVMAACLMISLSVLWRGNQPAATGAPVADAALLAQVDRQVSRAVPSPMEPLMNLVLWDGDTQAESGTVKTK
ncbi:MAG TPA: hypothetical protein VKR61_25070 [Bryobacteraceae bacterium]|nr:hypothetical protein [Bryobacteraceae bacterium]